MPDAVAPEINGLVQPGVAVSAGGPVPTPNQPTPPAEAMTPSMAAPDVTDRSINPAVAPPPPEGANKPSVGGHQKLLSMVQGLADGLAGFSAGLASKGKVSGAEVVQNLEAQRQQTKQAATAAAQAQKDAELRNKLTVAQTNNANIQNHLMTATLPDDISMSHMKAAEAQTKLGEEQFNLFANTGMNPQQIDSLTKGGSVDSKTSDILQNNAQRQYRIASQLLPATNPSLTALKSAIDSGNPAALVLANKNVQAEIQGQSAITEDKIKQAAAIAANPVEKLATPEALAAPGAQAAIQAKIDDPTTAPADLPRLRALLPQAAVAQLNAENIKAREARTQQIVNQGDPAEAGRLLADRSLTLSELKSRQVTPKFIADAILAAQKFDPTYKAAEAEAQGKIAASPANSQFFGNTDSLLVKGGTLDQLDKAYAALGNTQIPVINKLDNLRKAAVGSGPLAAAYAAQLGVADDYSKVMSGGTGSDTSRQQALDIMSVNLSPEARPAAINQIRQAVTSQRNGRVGTNPYMRDMYPDPSIRQETPGQAGTQPAAPAGASNEVWVGGKLTGHVVGNKYVPLGQ